MAKTQIKICGIYRPEDAGSVNRVHPDWFGMIINFPKSHRSLPPEQAAELRRLVEPAIPAVGVFVNQPVELVCDLLDRGVIDVAQLHGQEQPEDILEIRRRTGRPVWKAFQIRKEADIRRAEESPADLVLLDNGYGTGQTFDWTLVGGIHRPFALAGGLTPENIPQAIATLHPTLVDISSGVESNRIKDPDKMRRAVEAARG